VKSIENYLVEHNANPKPFRWTVTADEILENVARLGKGNSPPYTLDDATGTPRSEVVGRG
jgi:hypothetical protein